MQRLGQPDDFPTDLFVFYGAASADYMPWLPVAAQNIWTHSDTFLLLPTVFYPSFPASWAVVASAYRSAQSGKGMPQRPFRTRYPDYDSAAASHPIIF